MYNSNGISNYMLKFGVDYFDRTSLTYKEIEKIEEIAEAIFKEADDKFMKYLEDNNYEYRMGMILKKQK